MTQPQPPDAPSGKWENANDLYAYYLLDVEPLIQSTLPEQKA